MDGAENDTGGDHSSQPPPGNLPPLVASEDTTGNRPAALSQSQEGSSRDGLLFPIYVHPLIDRIGLTRPVFRVLGHFAAISDREGVCTESIERMILACRLPRAQIVSAIRTLEAEGLLVMGEGAQRWRCYTLRTLAAWKSFRRLAAAQPRKRPDKTRAVHRRIVEFVTQHSAMTGTRRTIVILVAIHANSKGVATVLTDTLVSELKVDAALLWRHLRAIQAGGEIAIISAGKRPYRPAVFRLTIGDSRHTLSHQP